jgi:two-component system phosphate regulon sensor histidine kinase PhoR
VRRRAHAAATAAAGAPLLAALIAWALQRDAAPVAGLVALWALGMAVIELVHWRMSGAPLRELADSLGAGSAAEARRALAELRASAGECESVRRHTSTLLEDLSSSLGEGLLVVSSQLEIRLINPVALRFCGVDRVDPGAHLLEILRNPQAVEAVRAAAAGATPASVVVENPRGLWEVHAFPVRDGGAVVLLADVGLVRKAAELRRRFVQDLSHELRSPLTVMRTAVEALESEVEAPQAELLIRQVERIDRLTAELYELASIEAGEVELHLESLPVAALLREVLGDFEPEALRAGVMLEIDAPDDLRCWADRRGLYRVLSNLVDNAIKYNRRGGWVRARGHLRGDQAVLQVADSGEGIPAAELGAVMQRFYRVDKARTPGRGGLGLGLAIVKHMVQLMGGSLSLDSREGVGTQVTVSLPAGVAGRTDGAPAAG